MSCAKFTLITQLLTVPNTEDSDRDGGLATRVLIDFSTTDDCPLEDCR